MITFYPSSTISTSDYDDWKTWKCRGRMFDMWTTSFTAFPGIISVHLGAFFSNKVELAENDKKNKLQKIRFPKNSVKSTSIEVDNIIANTLAVFSQLKMSSNRTRYHAQQVNMTSSEEVVRWQWLTTAQQTRRCRDSSSYWCRRTQESRETTEKTSYTPLIESRPIARFGLDHHLRCRLPPGYSELMAASNDINLLMIQNMHRGIISQGKQSAKHVLDIR